MFDDWEVLWTGADLLRTAHRIRHHQPISPRHRRPIPNRPDTGPRMRTYTRTIKAVVDGGEVGRVAGVVAELADAALPKRGAVVSDCRKARGGRGEDCG